MLANLHDHELALALDCDFQKSVARHVLHTRVGFVHELEQLIHHGFQELPVQTQKPRVLPDDVHDVGRDDGFMVLPPGDFAQVQKIANRGDQEPVLLVLRHGTGDRTNRPAKRVQNVPAVLLAVELVGKLAQHLRLRVLVIKVREINQRLAHDFVLHQHVVVLQRFPHDVPVLILHDEHLLRFRHARHHQKSELGHGPGVHHAPRATAAAAAAAAVARGGERKLPAPARVGVPVALVQVAHQHVPVIETHLEHLGFVRVRDVQEVLHTHEQVLLVLGGGFQERDVVLEELRQKYREVLDVRLFVVAAVGVRLRDLHRSRKNGLQLRDDGDVQRHEVRVVLWFHREAAYFAEALQRDVPELGIRRQLQQSVKQAGFENVPQRDPRQKRVQGLQGFLNQLALLRVRQHELAQVVNQREIRVQRVLQLSDLRLRQFASREIENLLGQKS
mmetsp:Transcript_5554/g.18318  ORF Transcript_5554/g.18318 Transcript_5554/m.18318 type:complete len:446 (-) Transcript_5554:816-2153(-)